ncbi:unnamed protein product [Moneuplotes crassus]|uniref:Pseudouridine synthase RsuA/RluA-like domain-containing protein n=1 Tax=Euplotes crassus TaxID=5936 RepID=A0AAD1XCR3_EUPCR|nr:unnamed protein product [Moneuplotes crassus]
MRNKNRRHRRKELEQKDLEDGVITIPNYLVKNGLRYVEKSQFAFRTYVKGRWVGRTLLDVLEDEFKTNDREYYAQAIQDQRILINELPTTEDHEIDLKDELTHYIERIEVPIIDPTLEIIEENDEYLIVNKPSSIPVHPCGNYKYNSLQLILQREHGYAELRVCNRLDKQTSGIVFCAKSIEAANNFNADLKSLGQIKKAYLARVIGKIDVNKETDDFTLIPDEPSTFLVDKALFRPKSSYCTTIPQDDGKKGKDSQTKFQFLFYDEDSNTSVLKCFPITGRTHQIRVHLKSIGHPIANDPKYGGELFNDIPDLPSIDEEAKEDPSDPYTPKLIEGMCLKIWLHAYEYTFKGKCYSTELPDWATQEYKIPHRFSYEY